MTESSYSNKRIAKNTLMLYVRMLLTMAITLYTSRIVLNTLGVEDFGIYNVVGGFVTMFAFLNSAMASATQRFLSFEIGRKDFVQLRNVFSMSVNIHFIIAFVILLLAETIGLWFVNTQLTIPADRMNAAQWVYQFSILSMMVSIVSVPSNAIIIAHERMNVFAWVSIAEVSLKLLIVFMLQWFGFDKLKLYAVLVFSVSLVIRLIYGVYCKYNFKESKFRFFWDKPLFKTLMSYAGWNLWGNASSVLYGQGINVLLNIFFGPTVNAARAIAYQVRGATNQFVQNFQIAMNPQIIKLYATNNLKKMHLLVFQGAKFSFFMLLILSLPILLETNIILSLWLKHVPEYTVVFTQLVIINILIDSFSRPLMTAAQATGKIKLYQSVIGGLQLLIVPISYLFLKLKFEPQVTLYITIIISSIALFVRLFILHGLVKLNINSFISKVIFNSLLVAVISVLIPFGLKESMDESFARFLIISFVALLSSTLTIYYIGLNKKEKKYILNLVKKFTKRIRRNKK